MASPSVTRPTIGFSNSVDSHDLDRVTYEPYEYEGKYSVDLTVDGRFRAKLDYKKYPFDNQNLNIEMELGQDPNIAQIFANENPTVFAGFNRILDYEVHKLLRKISLKSIRRRMGYQTTSPGKPSRMDL